MAIVRWTIGDASRNGLNCLKHSVKNFIKLYKEEFNYYICYNNTDLNELSWVYNYPIKLVDQKIYFDSLVIPPIKHPCWKLYPPRLSDEYQIFIDNDLVLNKKIDFNKYVNKNIFFATQAFKKNYGTFNDIINKQPHVNSGLFGIPEKFDLQKELNNLIIEYKVNWNNSHLEEQALIALIMHKYKFEIISLEEIYICYKDIKESKYGFHFVTLNENVRTKFWRSYRNKFL